MQQDDDAAAAECSPERLAYFRCVETNSVCDTEFDPSGIWTPGESCNDERAELNACNPNAD